MGERGARLARWVCVVSGAASAAGVASAGAWSPVAGKGQQITTVSRERGDFGETWRTDDLFDLGLSRGWAASLKLEGQLRTQTGYDDRTAFGVGIKKSFALGNRGAFALQGSVLGGEALDGPECASSGFETRAAVGTSYKLGGMDGFVNVEAAQKQRGDACGRQNIEIAAGLDLTDKWRVLGKAWSERGDGAESAKIEASVFRDFGKYSVGLGYREEVSGAFKESGIVAQVWTPF